MAYSDFNDNYQNRTAGLKKFNEKTPINKFLDIATEAFTQGHVQQNDAMAEIQKQTMPAQPSVPFRDTLMGDITSAIVPFARGVFDRQRGQALSQYAQNMPSDPIAQITGLMQQDPAGAEKYIPALIQAKQEQVKNASILARQKSIQEYINSLSGGGTNPMPSTVPVTTSQDPMEQFRQAQAQQQAITGVSPAQNAQDALNVAPVATNAPMTTPLSRYQQAELGALRANPTEEQLNKYLASLKEDEKSFTPYSEQAKLNADIQHGFITPEEAKSKGLSPDEVKLENAIRQEFEGLGTVKEFRTVDTAYTRVKQSVKDPSAAGDVALVFNFMKMLDPGSTVREGEFATAQNSAGVPDIVKNQWNKLLSGERLAPAQRTDFSNRATMLHQGAQEGYNATAQRYQDLAKEYGMKPERISKMVDISKTNTKTPAVDPETLKYMTPEERALFQ